MTAPATAGSTFTPPQPVMSDFGFNRGWGVDRHVRLLADITGDGRADIVGFGDDGVWVSLSRGDGTFTPPQPVMSDFGFNRG
jgi:hypothetical protein